MAARELNELSEIILLDSLLRYSAAGITNLAAMIQIPPNNQLRHSYVHSSQGPAEDAQIRLASSLETEAAFNQRY